jgi:hypothetical protein
MFFSIIGLHEPHIMMEYQKLIRLQRTAFDTQYSIIPPFHYSIGSLTANSTPLG